MENNKFVEAITYFWKRKGTKNIKIGSIKQQTSQPQKNYAAAAEPDTNNERELT